MTELPEVLGRVLSLVVWFVFGADLLLDGLEHVDWRVALYAVLSLTVIRMLPVALSMIGAGFSRPATVFIGWFGPRGLASVVFGLLIVEELPIGDARVQTVVSTIVAHRGAQRGGPRHQRTPTRRLARSERPGRQRSCANDPSR